MDKSYTNLFIERIINYPVSSNCFIIGFGLPGECILVDPSCGNGEELDHLLIEKRLRPTLIVLTHEHFDHIKSVEFLREKYKCKVAASPVCSENIGNAKKNLSLFYDQKGFVCQPADILVDKELFHFHWNNLLMQFHLTPGHSEGGLCFSIANKLFTGDTIMKEYEPVVKLPGGNKKKLESSITGLLNLYKEDIVVYPGHGDLFFLKAFIK